MFLKFFQTLSDNRDRNLSSAGKTLTERILMMKKTIILSIFVWTMATLLLGCGGGNSNSGSGIINDASGGSGGGTEKPASIPSITNSAPVANAGMDQTVQVGDTASLDGTGSADPDGDILSFQWTIKSQPGGSNATILDADKPNPSFTPDQQGNYVFQLVVTDTHGLPSSPATVTVSTINSAPVADAGPDQGVTAVGTIVSLGGQSFDPDGDTIVYSWSLKTKPSGSSAILSTPASPNPTFIVDVRGDYIIELVVNDPWTSSAPDTMLVSFDNLKPVADAGSSFSLVLGNPANLNGSGSYDPNGDSLTYRWSLVDVPASSTAQLDNPSAVNPSFLPDLTGTYVVSLIVNDGQVDSDPSTLSITVVSSADPVIQKLITALNALAGLDLSVFANPQLKKTLATKINKVIAYIDQGLFKEAKNELTNDILKKMDGCAQYGAPDNNDWIITCDAQNQVYPLILSSIEDLGQK